MADEPVVDVDDVANVNLVVCERGGKGSRTLTLTDESVL